MTNKTSSLSSTLKITGIITLSLTAIITIVVIISAISNSSEALGMLIGAGIIVVGVFMGMIELAASEMLSVKTNEVQSKSNE
jgi:hypothetical protein